MKTNRLVGGGLLGLAASIALLAADIRPVAHFFYLLAWWSYLVLLAGLNLRLTGKDMLVDSPRLYLRMALFSVPAWLFYEMVNLRIENWLYYDVPSPLPVRWVGYALAYATVTPAIMGTSALLRHLLGEGPATPKLPRLTERSWAYGMHALGGVCLALVGFWPRLFFPLIWAPAFLLFEPFVAKWRPEDSWLASLARGRGRGLCALLLGGLVCGVLWESLNFWAGAKWKYTIPGWCPSGPKLFEMPLLGYLGFLPFALGCASTWHFADHLWRKAGPTGRMISAALLAGYCVFVFWCIDFHTSMTFVSIFSR